MADMKENQANVSRDGGLLARLASKVNHLNPLGYPIKGYKNVASMGAYNLQPVDPYIASGNVDTNDVTSLIPGVMGIPFIPSIGISRDASSPINNAMFDEVAYITDNAHLSYLPNLDASDVGFMYVAMESVYLAWIQLVRAYAFHRNYSGLNLYTVKALYAAMRLDYDDFMMNMPTVLFKINEYAKKLNRLHLPKKFGTVEEHIYMTNHIFKDSDIDKSKFIVYYPKGFWQYDPTVPSLNWTDADPSTPLTFSQYLGILEGLMSHLIPDEDVATLNAYIRTAYDDSQLFKVTTINWDTFAEPIYDPEEISKLHNACFLSYTSVTGMNITQVVTSTVDTIIKWDPVFTVPSLACNARRILDQNINEPSEMDDYKASIYMWTCKVQTGSLGGSGTIKLGQCGNTILAGVHVVTYDLNMDLMVRPIFTFVCPAVVPTSGTTYVGFAWVNDTTNKIASSPEFDSLIYGSQFNCMPITYVGILMGALTSDPHSNMLAVANMLYIKYNWSYLDDEVLEKMQLARNLEAWGFSK